MDSETTIPTYQIEGQSSERSIPVSLVTLKGTRTIEGNLTVGEEMGRGESGSVREATITITQDEKTREVPLVLKSYTDQEKNSELQESYNRAYESQLVYYEALRRSKVDVIPTFRLAQDHEGNTLGIVMTNLTVSSLSGHEVSKVTTSKDDAQGNFASAVGQKKDQKKAEKVGLHLDSDSWMLQYSDRWKGLGKLIPQPVVSDIIGIKISNKKRFEEFLSQEENQDLLAEAKRLHLLI